MKLLKTFLLIILILSVIFFLQLNNDKVSIDLIFTQFSSAPVSMIIFGSISIGLIFGYILAVFSIMASKSKIKILQNKNKELTDELNDLRNVSVDESLYDEEDGDY